MREVEKSSDGDLSVSDSSNSIVQNKIKKKYIVAVIGTRGSGTSLCASMIHKLGIDMVSAEDLNKQNNGKTIWERQDLAEIHDDILGCFRKTADSLDALPACWWREPKISTHKRKLAEYIEGLTKHGVWGFKNNRALSLFPLWHEITNKKNIPVKVVFCLRNPGDIAAILKKQEYIDPDFTKLLWLRRHADFFQYNVLKRFLVLKYEDWFDGTLGNMRKLIDYLNIGASIPANHLAQIFSEAVPPPFLSENKSPYDYCSFIYKKLSEIDHNKNAYGEICNIFLNFSLFNNFYKNIYQQSLAHRICEDEQRQNKFIIGNLKNKRFLLEIDIQRLTEELHAATEELDQLRARP